MSFPSGGSLIAIMVGIMLLSLTPTHTVLSGNLFTYLFISYCITSALRQFFKENKSLYVMSHDSWPYLSIVAYWNPSHVFDQDTSRTKTQNSRLLTEWTYDIRLLCYPSAHVHISDLAPNTHSTCMTLHVGPCLTPLIFFICPWSNRQTVSEIEKWTFMRCYDRFVLWSDHSSCYPHASRVHSEELLFELWLGIVAQERKQNTFIWNISQVMMRKLKCFHFWLVFLPTGTCTLDLNWTLFKQWSKILYVLSGILAC